MQRVFRTAEKCEERQVATLSALMTIVMMVLLFLSIALVLVSVASASIVDRNFTRDGGWIKYEGEIPSNYKNEGTKVLAFEGEKIYFINTETEKKVIVITGLYEDDADTRPGCKDYPRVEVGEPWDCTEDSYYFKATEITEAGNKSNIGGWFGAKAHSFTLELEKKEVQEDEIFTLDMKKNNKRGGVMKLSIKKDDYLITNVSGEYIDEIPIGYYNETEFTGYDGHDDVGVDFDENGTLAFNTTELNMKEGSYTIILEDFATEVEKKVTIKVKKIFLDVELDEEVVKGDDIVIKITSSFYKEKVNVTVGDFYNGTSLPLDEDGKIMVTISTTKPEEVACGKHKVTVEVCDDKVTKYVTVKEGEASLEEVPEEATVGDIVTLKGTSNFGDFAVFIIEDVFKGEARISGDKFEWDWDTSGELEGYHGIDVFILSGHAPFSLGEPVSGKWQRKNVMDMSADIFLLLPEFSMTVQKNIAEGDDVVISGTAKGTDHVYVIVMNHKGEVKFPEGEDKIAEATVGEDEKWEENIGELDSGRYTVIALYEGKDGVTDAINETDKKWAAGDKSKTLEQRVAILMDAITSAGSDDLFEKADFSVSAPKVILEVSETVEIGDEVSVKAETNIKNGAKAFISLSQNSSILKKTFALVENCCVNASIDTSGLQPGKYNVAVDISGRASDEKVVTLVEKKEVEEEGKEEIAQNESLTEPGTVEGANESVGEFLNESQEGEQAERKIPVNVWDLLIAVVVAISISIAAKRKRY